MSQNLRLPEILRLARATGRVGVEELAQTFGVTLQTIRRDLTELAETGQLERVHGGAVLPSGTVNIAYAERGALNAGAKARIAETAAALIPNGAAIFLGVGTTTEALAQALSHHSGLLVVTNNLNIASSVAGGPAAELIVTGGHLRQSDGALVGPLASRTLRHFRFDIAVIGCSALDEAGNLYDYDIEEVGVSQTLLEQSRSVWLLADGAKFRRSAPIRIASIAEMARVVTDTAPPQPFVQACQKAGTALEISPHSAPETH